MGSQSTHKKTNTLDIEKVSAQEQHFFLSVSNFTFAEHIQARTQRNAAQHSKRSLNADLWSIAWEVSAGCHCALHNMPHNALDTFGPWETKCPDLLW